MADESVTFRGALFAVGRLHDSASKWAEGDSNREARTAPDEDAADLRAYIRAEPARIEAAIASAVAAAVGAERESIAARFERANLCQIAMAIGDETDGEELRGAFDREVAVQSAHPAPAESPATACTCGSAKVDNADGSGWHMERRVCEACMASIGTALAPAESPARGE